VRLHRAKRQYGCEVNIAPLIDVVFLLIIFFLTVSRIGRVQVEALTLPEATEGQKSEPLDSGRVIVNVHKDGRIVVAGQTLEMDELEQMLRTEYNTFGADNLSVVLRGDREALWARISGIMRTLAEIGIDQISVAVLEPGQAGGKP
jgi:biopolymer transport protein ExbD